MNGRFADVSGGGYPCVSPGCNGTGLGGGVGGTGGNAGPGSCSCDVPPEECSSSSLSQEFEIIGGVVTKSGVTDGYGPPRRNPEDCWVYDTCDPDCHGWENFPKDYPAHGTSAGIGIENLKIKTKKGVIVLNSGAVCYGTDYANPPRYDCLYDSETDGGTPPHWKRLCISSPNKFSLSVYINGVYDWGNHYEDGIEDLMEINVECRLEIVYDRTDLNRETNPHLKKGYCTCGSWVYKKDYGNTNQS